MEMTRPGRAGSATRSIRPERSGKGSKIFLTARPNRIQVPDRRPVQWVSLPERVAGHLREGIRRGQWSDPFPGVPGPGEEKQKAECRKLRRNFQTFPTLDHPCIPFEIKVFWSLCGGLEVSPA
jgi:hypothetical protein